TPTFTSRVSVSVAHRTTETAILIRLVARTGLEPVRALTRSLPRGMLAPGLITACRLGIARSRTRQVQPQSQDVASSLPASTSLQAGSECRLFQYRTGHSDR